MAEIAINGTTLFYEEQGEDAQRWFIAGVVASICSNPVP